MEMCDDGHAQICHDERNCPLCEKIDEMKEAVELSRKQGFDAGYEDAESDA